MNANFNSEICLRVCVFLYAYCVVALVRVSNALFDLYNELVRTDLC